MRIYISFFYLTFVFSFFSFTFALDKLSIFKGLDVGIGYQRNFISPKYKEYTGITEGIDAYQAFGVSYNSVDLLHFRILWRDIFRYEKVYPIGDKSKTVFGLWEKAYYERDLLNLNLFFVETFVKKETPIIFDIFFGYNFDKEVYNSKLTVNKSTFEEGYRVFFAELEDGIPINLQELKSTRTYTLLQNFNFQHIYLGARIYILKGWLGYCWMKTKQPITWWINNLFGKSAALIVRSDIESEGRCVGFGFTRKFGKNIYIYIPKIVEIGPLFGKSKWTIVKNAGLTPDYLFQVEAGPMVYISNETHTGLRLDHFTVDVMYSPYIFMVTGRDPFFGDPTNVMTNIVHRVSLTINYEF